MNYIKPVAKILGVKPGEAFRLTGYRVYQFRITENGVEYSFDLTNWNPAPDRIWHEILVGETEIVKLEGKQ